MYKRQELPVLDLPKLGILPGQYEAVEKAVKELERQGIAVIIKKAYIFIISCIRLPSSERVMMEARFSFFNFSTLTVSLSLPECALLVQSFDLGLDLVPQN